MRRRALLASIATAGLAGCQFDQSGNDSTASGGTQRSPSTTSGSTPESGQLPENPGPKEQSRFAGTDVPSMGDVAWYHEADESTPSYLHPETERASLPAEIKFTFYNNSEIDLDCGHWRLEKLHDGKWFTIGPRMHTADCRIVESGETKSWTLDASHGSPTTEQDRYEPGRSVFGSLGGGRYAVTVGYGHDTDESGALVELSGPGVDVVPEENLSVEENGAEVVVTSPHYESAERTGTVVVSRATDADRRLVAEQVLQPYYRGLRNTLPFLEDGVETVRLRTDSGTASSVPSPPDETDRSAARIEVDGKQYSVEATRSSGGSEN